VEREGRLSVRFRCWQAEMMPECEWRPSHATLGPSTPLRSGGGHGVTSCLQHIEAINASRCFCRMAWKHRNSGRRPTHPQDRSARPD
jgi:hypothetical protein